MNSVWKFNMEYLSFRILQTYKDQENDGGTQITE